AKPDNAPATKCCGSTPMATSTGEYAPSPAYYAPPTPPGVTSVGCSAPHPYAGSPTPSTASSPATATACPAAPPPAPYLPHHTTPDHPAAVGERGQRLPSEPDRR